MPVICNKSELHARDFCWVKKCSLCARDKYANGKVKMHRVHCAQAHDDDDDDDGNLTFISAFSNEKQNVWPPLLPSSRWGGACSTRIVVVKFAKLVSFPVVNDFFSLVLW